MSTKIKQNLNKLLLIIFSISPLAHAEIQEHLYPMGTLEQIPYGFQDEHGQVKGSLFEIMNEIIAKSGLRATNKLLPAKRLFLELKTGAQFCALLADTPLVSKYFDLLEPIGVKLAAGVLPKKGVKLSNYESLKQITIAVPLGLYFHEFFDNDKTLTKVNPPKYENAIQMLKYGRVDAAAGAIASLLYIANNEEMSDRNFDAPLILSNLDIYLACFRGTEKTVQEAMQASTVKLKEMGRIQEIYNQYITYAK